MCSYFSYFLCRWHLCFFQGDFCTLLAIKYCFENYGNECGQRINQSKSLFYAGSFSYHRKEAKEATGSGLGFSEGCLPFIFLGVLIFKGNPKRNFFRPLLMKPKASFNVGWGKLLNGQILCFLSWEGKLVILFGLETLMRVDWSQLLA